MTQRSDAAISLYYSTLHLFVNNNTQFSINLSNIMCWSSTNAGGIRRDTGWQAAQRNMSAFLAFLDYEPTRRCAGRPAAGLSGTSSRTEVSSRLQWLNQTPCAPCHSWVPPLRPRRGAPPCWKWRHGRGAEHVIVLRSRAIGQYPLIDKS